MISIHLSVCLCNHLRIYCLHLYVSPCPCIHLSACLSAVCLSVCVPIGLANLERGLRGAWGLKTTGSNSKAGHHETDAPAMHPQRVAWPHIPQNGTPARPLDNGRSEQDASSLGLPPGELLRTQAKQWRPAWCPHATWPSWPDLVWDHGSARTTSLPHEPGCLFHYPVPLSTSLECRERRHAAC